MKKIYIPQGGGRDFWLRIPMNNESAGRHLCMDDVHEEGLHVWLESGYGGCWTLEKHIDGAQRDGIAAKVPASFLGYGTYSVVMAGKFVNGDSFRTKRQLFIRLVDREDQADAEPTMYNEEQAYWAGPAVLSEMLSRDGLNTYELAVIHGYTGTVEEFLEISGLELQDLMVTKPKLSLEVQELLDKVNSFNTYNDADLDIDDENNNTLVRFSGGHVKTKNFDSRDLNTFVGDDENADLDINDEDDYTLVRFSDGHVKTKEFDSSAIEKKNISSNLWQIINGTHLADVFKKVCCIGDSLTAGFTKIGSVDIGSAAARPLGNNWPAYMENLTGGNQYDNIAIGSSTAHHWRYEDGPQPDYKPDLDLANDSTYEAYIVALGINDERTNVTVGTTSDIASNKSSNADTFCGNYDFIVRQLMEWNSKAHIFCLTIPLSEGNRVIPYNAIINDIGNLYSNKVHVISLEGEDVDLSWIAANFSNGHYCPIVYNYFATIIYRRISNNVWNNNTIFKETPYN